MEQSDEISELSAALVAFQADVSAVGKGGKNPHLRNTYTRLEDAILATREALGRHGLAVNQYPTTPESGMIAVRTRLRHSSGQYEDSTLAMPIAAGKGTTPAQQAGSALSYARRYAYLAVLGLASVDDDAEGTRDRGAGRKDAPQQQVRKAEQEQEIADARGALGQCTTTDDLDAWRKLHENLPDAIRAALAGDYTKTLARVSA